jgi:hypothetical protein
MDPPGEGNAQGLGKGDKSNGTKLSVSCLCSVRYVERNDRLRER